MDTVEIKSLIKRGSVEPFFNVGCLVLGLIGLL